MILLFLTEPVQYLPNAVLGAVIVSAAIGLIDPQAWRALAAVDRVEVAIAGVTTGCVIVFGVLEALVVAVGLSMIDTVRRSARPHDAVLGWVERLGRYGDVSLHPSATRHARRRRLPPRRPAVLRQRPLRSRAACARRCAPPRTGRRWLVFDAEAITHVDSTGLEALPTWPPTSAGHRSHSSWRDSEPHAGTARTPASPTIGPDRVYPSVHAAVDAYDP